MDFEELDSLVSGENIETISFYFKNNNTIMPAWRKIGPFWRLTTNLHMESVYETSDENTLV